MGGAQKYYVIGGCIVTRRGSLGRMVGYGVGLVACVAVLSGWVVTASAMGQSEQVGIPSGHGTDGTRMTTRQEIAVLQSGTSFAPARLGG